ncbi:hypothetical protein DFS34DRAFT_509281 [Phlyctochytrium arcticum]|nr:hypothetical protein DFS34DRAFT_509236 [Phlyctochytrium arcticum]KAI9099815.1 hypothetical protein DFS34DRAFT_509281 [Phlyctochytrium arcticum]
MVPNSTDRSDFRQQVDTTVRSLPKLCHLDDLPHDVLFHLLQHVPPLSLHKFSATCRSIHRFIEANTDALYRHYTTSHFGLGNPCLTYYHTKRLAHESIQEQTWMDMYWRHTVCKSGRLAGLWIAQLKISILMRWNSSFEMYRLPRHVNMR